MNNEPTTSTESTTNIYYDEMFKQEEDYKRLGVLIARRSFLVQWKSEMETIINPSPASESSMDTLDQFMNLFGGGYKKSKEDAKAASVWGITIIDKWIDEINEELRPLSNKYSEKLALDLARKLIDKVSEMTSSGITDKIIETGPEQFLKQNQVTTNTVGEEDYNDALVILKEFAKWAFTEYYR